MMEADVSIDQLGVGDSVALPAGEGTVMGILGGYLGGTGAVVVCNDRRFLLSEHDGVVVDRWDGWRYVTVLDDAQLTREDDVWTVSDGYATDGGGR